MFAEVLDDRSDVSGVRGVVCEKAARGGGRVEDVCAHGIVEFREEGRGDELADSLDAGKLGLKLLDREGNVMLELMEACRYEGGGPEGETKDSHPVSGFAVRGKVVEALSDIAVGGGREEGERGGVGGRG